MDQNTATQIVLVVGSAALSGLATAVGFMTWTRLNLKRIEDWGRESHKALDEKMNKNYEALDLKIKENQTALLGDLSGIGGKVSKNETNAARRYHNLTAALMLAAPITKENEVSRLLKEEAS